MLQVAHFLRDQTTCTKAAAELAAKIDETRCWNSPASAALLAALDALEPDLLILVFEASTLPLTVSLTTLPPSLHGAAVRSRLSDGGCLVLSHQLRRTMIPTLAHQLSSLSHINHLDVSHNHLGPRAAGDLSLLLSPLQVCHTHSCTCTVHAGRARSERGLRYRASRTSHLRARRSEMLGWQP
jgi:hypothetical protein